MMKDAERNIPLADGTAIPWEEHPRIKNVFMKSLLTSADNPLANISLVKVPVGASVSRHLHANEVETVYLLAGRSESPLTLAPLSPSRRDWNTSCITWAMNLLNYWPFSRPR
jgi:hypothetical protein